MWHEISLLVKLLCRFAWLAAISVYLVSQPVFASSMGDVGEDVSRDWLGGIPESKQLSYEVIRKGKRIGFQHLSFDLAENGDLTTNVYIRLDLKFGFITLFRYIHANQEIWRDGEMISLQSKTYNNGKDEFANFERRDGKLVGEGYKYSGELANSIISTSYFNPNFIRQNQLVSTQDGRKLDIDVTPLGPKQVPTANGPVTASGYRLSGDLKLDIWYTAAGQWVRTEFDLGGDTIIIRGVDMAELPAPASWEAP
jgi:hypothetical protein